MTTTTILDGQTVQSTQNGPPSDVYLLTGSSTIVGAGAGTFFASNAPSASDVLYLTGISAQPGGYVGDVGVLGASHATVLMGGIDPLLFGGVGKADIFWGTGPALLVTGSGDLNIIGNPTGAGITYGGGIASITHDSSGTTVRTGLGATDHLFAAGPVSAA